MLFTSQVSRPTVAFWREDTPQQRGTEYGCSTGLAEPRQGRYPVSWGADKSLTSDCHWMQRTSTNYDYFISDYANLSNSFCSLNWGAMQIQLELLHGYHSPNNFVLYIEFPGNHAQAYHSGFLEPSRKYTWWSNYEIFCPLWLALFCWTHRVLLCIASCTETSPLWSNILFWLAFSFCDI